MRTKIKRFSQISAMVLALPLLHGCLEQRVYNNGPVFTQDQLDLIPIGSSQDQVLLALGTPSSQGQFDQDVFYYISQKRARTYEFEKLKLIDQRVLSVYFDEEKTVNRIANYGLQDGRVFDFHFEYNAYNRKRHFILDAGSDQPCESRFSVWWTAINPEPVLQKENPAMKIAGLFFCGYL